MTQEDFNQMLKKAFETGVFRFETTTLGRYEKWIEMSLIYNPSGSGDGWSPDQDETIAHVNTHI